MGDVTPSLLLSLLLLLFSPCVCERYISEGSLPPSSKIVVYQKRRKEEEEEEERKRELLWSIAIALHSTNTQHQGELEWKTKIQII